MFCHVCALKMLFCFDMLLAWLPCNQPGSLAAWQQSGTSAQGQVNTHTQTHTRKFTYVYIVAEVKARLVDDDDTGAGVGAAAATWPRCCRVHVDQSI